MICKKDVILWFKELESYKRIDTMCALLITCLPFELRFLGTCLEELGRRDSQELRGMELRVNNPQDLATDMVACQKGEPTDKKIRRKMALYLALIRACNRTCVAEIFRTLEGWGDRDFSNMTDMDTLQELLLVYKMATYHPVFSFDQHMKCTEIYDKIKENKLVSDQSIQNNITSLMYGQGYQQQIQHLQTQPIPVPLTHPEHLQQHALHSMNLTTQHSHTQLTGPPTMQAITPQSTMPLNFNQGPISKMITQESNLQHPISVDGIPVLPEGTFVYKTYPANFEATSPIVSQHSSPASSRTGSPNRTSSSSIIHQQPQSALVRNGSQRTSGSLKNIRRPSVETTPPPMSTQQIHQQQVLTNLDILAPNSKPIDEVIISSDGSGQQLQSLIRNGFTRNGQQQRLKSSSYSHSHQQLSQPPLSHNYQTLSNQPITVNMGLNYKLIGADNLVGVGGHLIEGSMASINSNKSGGSESGSPIGSCAESSPPDTPTLLTTTTSGNMRITCSESQQQGQCSQKLLHQVQQTQHNYKTTSGINRINGRSDKLQSLGNTGGVSGSGAIVSSGANIIYAQNSTNTHHSLVQSHPTQLYGSDIVLAPGGNAGTITNIMQSTANNNNNTNNNINTNNNNNTGNNNNIGSLNIVSIANSNTNNNMTSTAVLMSAPTVCSVNGTGILSNIIPSSAILQSPHQQQYNNGYPYHAAVSASAAHLASSSRPPLLPHNPNIAPPPPPTNFALSSFQIPPNEIIYPYHHPATIAFLHGPHPPPPPVSLRTSNSGTGSNTATPITPTTTQIQQQHTPQTQISQSALMSVSYSNSNMQNKPLSCFNCGSQGHSGRDCNEATMDEVTRSPSYKLDYSVTVSSSNSSPSDTPLSGIVSITLNHDTLQKQQQIHTLESSTSVPVTSTQQQNQHQPTTTPTVSPLQPTALAGAVNKNECKI